MKSAKPMVVLMALLVGCGGSPSEELRRALATSSELRMEPPQQTEPSPYWVLTQQVAQHMNQTIGNPLDMVAGIIALPPDEEDDNGAMWLLPLEPQSPIDRRLVVHREAPDHNNFQIQVKPTSAGESAWQPFISGSVLASGGLRAGALIIDYSMLHVLDPAGQPDGGLVDAAYEITENGPPSRGAL